MSWRNPRGTLLLAVALDLLGLAAFGLVLMAVRGLAWVGQLGWLLATCGIYLTMGWLFGTYTVLRWRRLPRWTMLRRMGLALLATLALVAMLRWLLNPADVVWVVQRANQLGWLLSATLWSLAVRLGLRRGTLLPDEPQLLLVVPEAERDQSMAPWRRTPQRQMPRSLEPAALLGEMLSRIEVGEGPFVLAVSPSFQQMPDQRAWQQQLESLDPRRCILTTPLALAERQLERLPPALLPEPWLSYDAIPWNGLFSLQRQLKRVADVVVALLLLLLAAPAFLLAVLLIWLEDQGPVLYLQKRSGWLGQPFVVMKLRTMAEAPVGSRPRWTQPGDERITQVGQWLRRSRLDELPQLINVIRGDMSLIGPRPERPELETDLEAAIPHYRKRHWMRPGLSGWAQVCAPYAASVDDSELKLSYDLYYLKNFSTWLDLVILLRTIKTVLKVAGR